MLGDQVSCIEKKKKESGKKIEKREERERKNASHYLDFINEPLSLHLWSD